jgi:phospholipid/cholesterol/gamma-HCH transport system substrate-binding protein
MGSNLMDLKNTAPASAPGIRHLEFKAGLVLSVTGLLAVLFMGFILHTRGVFEAHRELTLIAPDGSGVAIGMPITLSGLAIGEVSRLTHTPRGEAAIVLRIREKDIHWLRQGSSFWLSKNILGNASISINIGNPNDPPLAQGAIRPLQSADITRDFPEIIQRVKTIVTQLEQVSRPDASLAKSLNHMATVTGRMTGEHGMIGGLLGPHDAQNISHTVQKTNTLIDSLHGVSLQVTQTLGKAEHGVETLNAALNDTRSSLKRVDDILVQAHATSVQVHVITSDVKAATHDLSTLRREVDESVTKANHLVQEVDRKWPFSRTMELETP